MNQVFAFLLVTTHAPIRLQAVDPYALTSDRLWASLAAIVALMGAIIGGMALSRAARGIGLGKGRNGAIVALTAGLIAAIVGALLLATADGGPGTGNGVVGAAVAVVLGLIAMVEGGLVVARSRRIGATTK